MSVAVAEQVKLKNVGESLCMGVQKAELVPFGKYPEYAFVGFDSSRRRIVDLRVPQKSADRQLARLSLTLADTVGLTLLFSRGENPADATKAFWNIDKQESGAKGTGGAIPATAAAHTRQSTAPPDGVGAKSAEGAKCPPLASQQGAPTSPAPTEEKHSALYKRITGWMLAEIVPMYEAAGVPMTDQGVARCVNTLFYRREETLTEKQNAHCHREKQVPGSTQGVVGRCGVQGQR